MTPLIREIIDWTTTAGMDPTELQWFDISGLTADQMAASCGSGLARLATQVAGPFFMATK